MFAMSTTSSFAAATATVAVRPRLTARRAANVVRRAADEGAPKISTSDAINTANEEWTAQVVEDSGDEAPAFKFSAEIDPADGTIAYAAPLGDDQALFSGAMLAFKEPRAVEIINGRVAMLGWMAALGAEVFDQHSLSRQMFTSRTFTLADGVIDTVTSPAAGLFLIPAIVMAVLAASLAPVLRNNAENGLNEVPQDFGPFKASSEMTNGRAAMVGLAALMLAENFTGGNPLL
eukprot:CAMPEP_0197574856 /NCGR_PEP_ID=MMETSP1326-20131121/452_1 /TAXON_ID=1155430 /ORGANISM="Genus nov. species nov., Strain RCC2288" /LENGTH=232 /DNA_ID=CAMNT_0043137513 /DNA_START=90 /DNA_END=788 /DNA_ORIENTATION=-